MSQTSVAALAAADAGDGAGDRARSLYRGASHARSRVNITPAMLALAKSTMSSTQEGLNAKLKSHANTSGTGGQSSNELVI